MAALSQKPLIPWKSFPHCRKKSNRVYPPEKNIFRAFELTPVGKVKVVLIGQDPYHGEGQADGLCFSVNENVKLPPSLKNIFKEIFFGIWGVFLL